MESLQITFCCSQNFLLQLTFFAGGCPHSPRFTHLNNVLSEMPPYAGYPRTPLKGQRAGVYTPRMRSEAARSRAYQARLASSRAGRRPVTVQAVLAAKETGYVDTAFASYDCDTTGDIVLLNTVPQNASVNGRIGKKISMKSLQCRGNFKNGTTASTNDCAMLIVYDKRPDGNLPAITDILVTANANSFNNTQNEGRFQIVKRVDQKLNGNLVADSMTSNGSSDADFYLDLKGKQVVYKAAGTGAIGDIEQGALYLVTVGSTAASTAAATANVGFRLRYYDM